MNTIKVRKQPSKFCTEPHLVLLVDETPLDVLLEAAVPGRELEGLIPPFEGLDDPLDWEVLQSRTRASLLSPQRLPVLVCPDDVDFSCSVVIADVEPSADKVVWGRLGLAVSSPSPDRESIGSDVEWFPQVGPFAFDRTEYVRAFEVFALGSSGNEPNG